jgi:hypothetical protein
MKIVFKTDDEKLWHVPDSMVASSSVLVSMYGAPIPTIDMPLSYCNALTHAWTREPTLLWESVTGKKVSLNKLLNAMHLARQLHIPMPRCLQGVNALVIMTCLAGYFIAKGDTVSRPAFLETTIKYSADLHLMFPTVFHQITDADVPEAILWSCEMTDITPRGLLENMIPRRDMKRISSFSADLASLW